MEGGRPRDKNIKRERGGKSGSQRTAKKNGMPYDWGAAVLVVARDGRRETGTGRRRVGAHSREGGTGR